VPVFSGEPAFRRRVFVVNAAQYILEAERGKRNAGSKGRERKKG